MRFADEIFQQSELIMEYDKNGKLVKDEIKKWFLNLVSSLKTLPKRSDAPPKPRHPSEAVE
jgi:hypothetical protein